MHLRRALAALLLLLAAACTGDGDGRAAQPPAPDSTDTRAVDTTASDPADTTAAPPASEDETTTTAKPDAEVKGRCKRQPQLGDEGEELVANLKVVNTGNLGVFVRVASRWPIDKNEGVARWNRVKIEQGETLPLNVRMPVFPTVADGVRDALERGRPCRVRHRVTGAFGIPGEG